MVKSVITCMYYNCKRKHNEAIVGVMWTLSQCDYPLNPLFHTVSKKFEFVEWSILNDLFKPDILFKFVFVALFPNTLYFNIISLQFSAEVLKRWVATPQGSCGMCLRGRDTEEKNQLLLYFFV